MENKDPRKPKVFGNFAKNKPNVNILKIKKTDLGLDFIHDENSLALGIVADKHRNLICGLEKIIDSSQTYPRSISLI